MVHQLGRVSTAVQPKVIQTRQFAEGIRLPPFLARSGVMGYRSPASTTRRAEYSTVPEFTKPENEKSVQLAMKTEIRQRWRTDDYIGEGYSASYGVQEGYPWVEYEEYMVAQILRGDADKVGIIIVDFPPHATEDNALHTHPLSDRMITVIKGSGEFIARKDGEVLRHAIKPGTRVWMPRGVLHTFLSSAEGLLVESVHNPWIPFEHPGCLTYPKEKVPI